MCHLQARGQYDVAVVRRETSAGDHAVPQAEVEMIYMFQEHGRLHAVSLRVESSGHDLLFAAGLPHLEMFAPGAHSRSVHVTSLQGLAHHHLLLSENDLLHQGEVALMVGCLLEEPTRHLATPVTVVPTDQDLALPGDVMIVPHFKTILGGAHHHLVPLEQYLLVLRGDHHLLFTRKGRA